VSTPLEFVLPATGASGSKSLVAEPDPAERYDVAIVGAGPAGMTAAVYCCRKALKTLLLTRDIGGQMLWTSGIENYMGFQYVTGQELTAKFKAQLEQFPLALARLAHVLRVEPGSESLGVVTAAGPRYRSRCVILATGKRPRRLEIPGETELTGHGVSYCATCDAPLYAGQDVAVVGGGNSALTSVLDLASRSRRVYSIHRRTEYRADPVLVSKVEAAGNVQRLLGCRPTAIIGSGRVTALDVAGATADAPQRYPVTGVFVEVGLLPNSEPVQGIVELNSRQEVLVNCRAETSLPGLFAGGDVTSVIDKQIVIAAAEGAKAALAAHAWLLSRPVESSRA
jgi:alkyl hydroperoxide reductase subunit F